MALANFTDLSSAIGTWLHRTDLAANIPDFIRLAEARMQMDLDVRNLEQTTTITTTAAVNQAALPTDLNQVRSMSITYSGITLVLDHMPMGQLITRWGSATSAIPRNYSIQGSNIYLGPCPDSTYSITLDYYANIAGLSSVNQTNVILTNYPDLYLHCCLIYAGQFTRDIDVIQGMEMLYAADLSRININNWGQMGAMTAKVG